MFYVVKCLILNMFLLFVISNVEAMPSIAKERSPILSDVQNTVMAKYLNLFD
jgi:hypothetical protein